MQIPRRVVVLVLMVAVAAGIAGLQLIDDQDGPGVRSIPTSTTVK